MTWTADDFKPKKNNTTYPKIDWGQKLKDNPEFNYTAKANSINTHLPKWAKAFEVKKTVNAGNIGYYNADNPDGIKEDVGHVTVHNNLNPFNVTSPAPQKKSAWQKWGEENDKYLKETGQYESSKEHPVLAGIGKGLGFVFDYIPNNVGVFKPFQRMVNTAGEAIVGKGQLLDRNGNKIANPNANLNTNKVIDTIADMAGNIAGISAIPMGGKNLYNAGSEVNNLLANKLTGKIGNTALRGYANTAAENALNMGLGSAADTARFGGNAKEVAKSGLEGALTGAAFGVAGKGLGDLKKSAFPKWNTVYDSTNNLKPLGEDLKVKGINTKGNNLNPFKSELKGTNTLNLVPSSKKFTVNNKPLNNALNEYDDAVKQIQNYWGHWKLDNDEIQLGAEELGIDLDGILNKVKQAEGLTPKDIINNAAESGSLRRVALGEDIPKIKTNSLTDNLNPLGKSLESKGINAKGNNLNPLRNGLVSNKEINSPLNSFNGNNLNPLEGNLKGKSINTNGNNLGTLKSNSGNILNPFEKNTVKESAKTINEKISTPNSITETIEGTDIPKVDTSNNKYVNADKLEINLGKNDKQTAKDIRQAYTGMLNGQIVTGNQLKDTIQKLAPKEQEGIQLWLDVGGDKAKLQGMVNNPDTQLDKLIPNSDKTYREAYKQALNLSPNAQQAAKLAQQYYSESGNTAFNLGTTNSILDNYANRIWNKETGNTARMGNSGLNTYTGHSKERFYDTIGEGILNGKEPTTLNAGDLLSIHNGEMARVNTNMKLANSMKDSGIGSFVNGKAEPGFTSIDSLSQKIPTKDGTLVRTYQVPEGIANGLKAITDPNYLKQWGKLDKIGKYQGVLKTVNLSYSLFHHITLATQALYNNTSGVDFIRHINDLTKLNTPEFNEMEQDFAKHTGMTTKVADNLDTLGKLSGNKTVLDKLTNIPVLKQLKQFSDKNTDLLFNKMQRWLKVTDYNNKVLDYVAKHPETEDAALTKVKRSIAEEVNNAYGGLNFEALGRSKTALNLERLGLLAPDWTESSIRMVGNAFKNSAGGAAARKQYLVGIGGGILLTEGLNHILTGHFTDKNPKGHELQVEVQPGVYVSAFKSGIGDLTKLASNVITSGVGGGFSKSLQAKGSPLLRTSVGLLANKNYNGQQIYGNSKKTNLQNDLNVGNYLLQNLTPVPFGVSNIQSYNQDNNLRTPLGNVIVGAGLGTYSKDKTNPNNPSASYQGNFLNKFLNPDPDQKSINNINNFIAQKKINSAAMNNDILNAVKSNKVSDSEPDITYKYHLTHNQYMSLVNSQQKKLDEYKKTPLVQAFDKLSRTEQWEYLRQHPEDYNQLIHLIKSK